MTGIKLYWALSLPLPVVRFRYGCTGIVTGILAIICLFKEATVPVLFPWWWFLFIYVHFFLQYDLKIMAPKKAAAAKAAPKAAAKKGSSPADKSSTAHTSVPVKHVSEKSEANGRFDMPNRGNCTSAAKWLMTLEWSQWIYVFFATKYVVYGSNQFQYTWTV